MLGIKTIMAENDHIESLIFDEIDSGISGRTAQMVSEKMNELGLQPSDYMYHTSATDSSYGRCTFPY